MKRWKYAHRAELKQNNEHTMVWGKDAHCTRCGARFQKMYKGTPCVRQDGTEQDKEKEKST